MQAKFIVFLLCLIPGFLYAKQETQSETDLELFEFLAIYGKDDEVFIDSEIDEKNEHDTKQQDTASEHDE